MLDTSISSGIGTALGTTSVKVAGRFTVIGKFDDYVLPDDDPEKPMQNMGARFQRNETYGDWYDFCKVAPKGTYMQMDDEGYIYACEPEADRIAPDSYTIVHGPAMTQEQRDAVRFQEMKLNLETGEFYLDIAPELMPALSQRQFFIGMAKRKVITPAEAMAFLRSGTIPALMAQAVDMALELNLLPEGLEDYELEAAIVAATDYRINHPFTEVIAGVLGWTEEELREFWDFAVQIP